MNRKYTVQLFREVVEALAAAVPDVCLGCDIIAGFPGETDAEFREGLRFVESLPIAYLHVFPFSPRSGTPAAAMSEQLPGALIHERARMLRELSERKKEAFHRSFVGRDLSILVQGTERSGVNGLSRNYVPVKLFQNAHLNTEMTVRVTAVTREGVMAECIDG